MPRALFEKTGNAAYISHLDLMRLFQRAFKRADLPLTHTKGYNPRPSVSIALPLSLGAESVCELLDFDLEGERIPSDEILNRLNPMLTEGVRVREIYDSGAKLKNLSFLTCEVTLEYDAGIPEGSEEAIRELFRREEILLEKKSKNGPTVQNIIPMIRSLELHRKTEQELVLDAVICCQNPSLNPAQLAAAIETNLPQWKPDFVRICRRELYDHNMEIFR